MATPRSIVELRVLDGPNRWLDGPAIQLRLDVGVLLDADRAQLAGWIAESGLGDDGQDTGVGTPGGSRRRQVVHRWLRDVARHMASLGGVDRLHVITADGFAAGEVIVAFPWSREKRATKLAEWIAWTVDDAGEIPLAETFATAADRLRHVSAGPRSTVARPTIPVVGITGTNGKTTTTRLLAHLLMTAGRTPAWNSTDGVYVTRADRSGGERVEQGDWAGFNGAARVLATPGVDVGVIEIARGGILRRGMGVAWLDVAVVTNVTEDHMGEMGIHTLDDLARVKGTVVRAVRDEGWAVLNAEDARVAAMSETCRGRICWTAVDPAAVPQDPALAVTVHDGIITALVDGDAEPIIGVDDVPMTMRGMAAHNVANALSAAGAALACGVDVGSVAEGLRTFTGDADANPGRLNVYARDGVHVIADIAHNVDSMVVLTGVARAAADRAQPAGRLVVIAGSLGDRTADIISGIAMAAAEAADVLLFAEKRRYLRGSDPTHVVALLQAGAAKAGWEGDVPVHADELDALDEALASVSAGDVVAFAVHEHKDDIAAELAARGFAPTTL